MVILYTMLIILAVILTVALIFIFTSLKLVISVGNSGIYIKILKFGFSFNIPLDKMKNKSAKSIKKPEDEKNAKKLNSEDSIMKKFFDMRNNFMRQKKALSEVLGYLKGKISVNETGFIGKFGTGNPVTGGIAYGSVCAFVNTISSFSGNFFVLEKPPVINVDFKPQEAVFEIKCAFLVEAKPYYIVKAFLIYKKISKETK